MKNAVYSCFLLLLMAACNDARQPGRNFFAPKISEAIAHSLPGDSVLPPRTVTNPVPEIKTAGAPVITYQGRASGPVEAPQVIEPATVPAPQMIIPGTGDVLKPLIKPATKKIVPAGAPEVIKAHDGVTKDNNPSNFTIYKVSQGLKQSTIRSMCQDRAGNIWLGTYSGGVSRFNGRTFTHFTETQGLGNNVVFSILQDKKGNMWFGTNGGGATCYDGEVFIRFTESNGLSKNEVYCMLEDRKGNLWFGTNGGGACCYNGKSFTHFKQEQGLPNTVFSIYEDKKGNIWFGTIGGAFRYDGKAFTCFTTEQGLLHNVVLKITGSHNGGIWFGTLGGASRYNGTSFTNFTTKQGLGDNIVYTVLEDGENNTWFGTSAGISCYNGKFFTHHTEEQGLSNNVVYCVLEDKSGMLWFGTNAGLNLYYGKNFIHYKEAQGLSNNVVYSMLRDRQGHLWFGTNGGGAQQSDGSSLRQYAAAQGLANNVVYGMCEDKKGRIWFATGGGLSVFDGRQFTNYSEEHGLDNNTVYCVLEDGKGNIWLGTDGAGLVRYDGKAFTYFTREQGLGSNVIYTIFEDRAGKLWLGTYEGVSCYDGKSFIQYKNVPGLSGNLVYSILQDRSGNIWFGTNAGAYLFNGKTFMQFTETQGLINNAVLSIVQDKTGDVWFGTRMGLSRLNHRSLSALLANGNAYDPLQKALFYNYSGNDGFLGLNCRRNSVLQDGPGNIWWGSDLLTCYKTSNNRRDNFPPAVQITDIKLFGEKILWADLGAVQRDSTGGKIVKSKINDTILANGVLLKNIRFSGLTKWYNLPEHLSLPYNNNNIAFDFTGIDFQSQNHIKYRYRLVGYDSDWSSVSDINEATYGNLRSGSYTFKVMAMNQQGAWSRPAAFTFEVRSAWWQTWWSRVALALAITFCIMSYIKLRENDRKKVENEIRKLNRELEQKVMERTEMLAAVNLELEAFSYSVSHDLRAPLRAVNGYAQILIEDYAEKLDEEGKKIIESIHYNSVRMGTLIDDLLAFSKLGRKEIQKVSVDMNKLVQDAVAEATRSVSHHVNIKIGELHPVKADYNLLQQVVFNLVSNAVKYSSKKEAPLIEISSTEGRDEIVFSVKDNGAGFNMQYANKLFGVFERLHSQREFEGTGVGLAIVHRIISKHGGRVWAEGKVDEGATFYFSLKVN